ncbi:hypothetical protein J8L88_01005 [Aquimarina sp. MMG015]|uniref:hypothetical protein n=1 Tax=Aquimarina sp. MMG015 TaxID=2822689 RepID=UPI001B39CEF0|nr:hypothetical protein [Aquimarina sp. MMG015]MBQ4801410.1 hypothetical protein [Aquimarina sp. MMG015]
MNFLDKALATIIFFLALGCNNSTLIKERKDVISNFNDEKYVINGDYRIGDVRRYGCMPNSTIGNHPYSKKHTLETILDIAEKGIEITFPEGYYKSELVFKGRENVKVNFNKAEFGGSIQIIDDAIKKIKSSNIILKGQLTTYTKFFTRNSNEIYVEDLIIRSDTTKSLLGLRSMGCDIYAGTKNLRMNNLVVGDLGSGSEKYKFSRAALQIHGWGNNPEGIIIKKVLIKSSDRHGVYLTGDRHKIDELIVDNFGVGSVINMESLEDAQKEESKMISGVWFNKCNNSEIGSIEINKTNSKGRYSIWFDEGKFEEPTIIEHLILIGKTEKLPINSNDAFTNVLVKKFKQKKHK